MWFTPVLLTFPSAVDHHTSLIAHIPDLLPELADKKSDLFWLNETGEPLGIEEVRQLRLDLQYAYQDDRVRVAILQQLDRFSTPAQNALLKLLEEPPANTLMVLTSSQPEGVLSTIHSRCQLRSGQTHLDSSQASETIELPSDLLEFVVDSKDLSHGALATLSDQLKDRELAQQTLQTLVHTLHQKITTHPTTTYTQTLQFLLFALDRLAQNAHVQLTLDHLFFRIKQLHS